MDELEIIQYQQVNGLSVFANTVTYRSPHFHKDWELLWVLDAPLTVTCMQRDFLVEPGELVLFPPNMTHELVQKEQLCTFLCLQISPTAFATATNISTEDIRLRTHLSPEDYAWVRRTTLDIASAYFTRSDFYELYCFGQCGLLLHRLLTNLPYRIMTAEEAANTDRQNARLLRLVQFVDANFSHKIRLSDFAAQEGCSVSYLSHFIKNTMNQTFQEYVNSVRFNHACKLIAAGKDSMLSISVESGFSDYRYFSRAFQKAYGMTPAEYSRKAHLVLPEDTTQGHSHHSEEQFLTRGQSLYVLKWFQAQLSEENI
ncbi:MAG: helix-turn-helix domain-containing protein [Oscillospiraceae bacterium]|nr:helix-turn-helix domain-containing protein [Oscillospiraceae bacterium]